MPKRLLVPLLLGLAAACADGRSAEPRADARAEAVHAAYLADLNSLAAAVERLDSAVARGRGEQRAFAEARAAYKRVELLVELYTPAAAKQLNGPALPRVAEDDPTQTVIPPEGFQVVEEMLFPAPDPAARGEALAEVRVLAANLRRVREYAAVTRFTDAHVWDAMRQEVARVVVLGVSGFDSPVALRSVPEAAQAFRALRAAVGPYDADLRTAFLEDQVADVVRSPAEMHGELERAAAELRRSPDYAARFARAFGRDAEGAVTGASVRAAVAAYVRSLVALDSRFDRYVRGDRAALSASEKRGFNLFMGRAKCGTCHFAPLFNGTVPPAYADTEAEVLGVPSRPVVTGAVVDPDPGRLRVHGIHLHRHAFKTPTVRNAELTAPYMHNGVFRTLEEVVDFYDRGGGAGIGIRLPNQTLPPDPLELADRDRADLVAFMRALTDTVGTTARPATGRGY